MMVGMSVRLARWVTTTSPFVLLLAAQSTAERELSRAMQLAARGEFPAAEAALRPLEKTHPNEFEVRYRLGLVLLRQAKHSDAAVRFEAATQLAPNSALGWLGLAQARLKLGRRTEALDAASRAAKLAASDAPVWRGLAMVYADAEDFERAAEFEERWGRASPVDTKSLARSCEFRVLAGSAAAVETCRAAVERGESADLYRLLGRAHRLAKDPSKAAESYQSAIRLAPDQPAAYFELATMFLDHRTPEPAIALLTSASARFPKEPEFVRLLGLAYYQTGNTGKALDAFFSVCDLDPDSEAGYASFETLLGEAGPRKTEIVARLRSFQRRRPASPIGHYLLAKAGEGDTESLLGEATKAEPRFWPAHYELGQLLESRGDLEQAVIALQEAARLNPDYAPAHYSLAQIYTKLGDRRLATAHRTAHHELLNRERRRAEQRRTESPALAYRIESESERRKKEDQK